MSNTLNSSSQRGHRPIDAASAIPRYVQLRDILSEQIDTGLLKPGDRLPPERELVTRYGLARMTIRQAIALLVDDGYLERYQGKGTFVLAPKSSVPRDLGTSPGQHSVTRRSFIPHQPTVFYGRAGELEKLDTFLADPDTSIITLTGPGGIGKTRLATELASRHVAAYRYGVFFIPLASVQSLDAVVTAIADALAFTFHPQTSPIQQLLDFLREKEMLMVFDNFEHLLGCTSLVSDILMQAPRVTIVATSRERLNLQGEFVFELGGLEVPAEDDQHGHEAYTAVRLFLDRARHTKPSFEATAEDMPHITRICHLVEGMPLAIELAAVWVNRLTCETIADEIEQGLSILSTSFQDVPMRHKSIRALFEQSWNQLSETERKAYLFMSVFRGGFSRDAATFVAHSNLTVLSTLVEKSFLKRRADGRYDMHELLRQFSEEKLSEHPALFRDVRERHCAYFMEFVNGLGDLLETEGEEEAIEAIGEEINNIRAAWDFGVETENVEHIAGAIGVLCTYYETRSLLEEGKGKLGAAVTMLRQVYDRNPSLEMQRVLSKGLSRFGVALLDRNDYAQARDVLSESCALARDADDREQIAYSLRVLGSALYQLTDYAASKKRFEESLKLYRDLGLRSGVSAALMGLGGIAEKRGEYTKAKRLWDEALTILKSIGTQPAIAGCLTNLGFLEKCLGDFQRAKSLLYESIRRSKQSGYRWGVAHSCHCLAILASKLGNYDEARMVDQQSLELYEDMGSPWGVAWCCDHLGDVARVVDDYDESDRLLHKALGIFQDINDRIGTAWCTQHLGMLAYAQGDTEKACTMLEQSSQIRRDIGEREALPYALNALGHIKVDLGALAEAQRLFMDSLEVAMESRAIPAIMDGLIGMASVSFKQRNNLAAAQIASHVLSQTACELTTRERAQRVMDACTKRCSAEELAAARALGTASSMDQLFEELWQKTCSDLARELSDA